MAETKQYVSNIRLSDKNSVAVPAGIPFRRSLMVPSTFNSLTEQGHIRELAQGATPAAPIKPRTGKALASGLASETPDAALEPPKKVHSTVAGAEHTKESALAGDTTKGKPPKAPKTEPPAEDAETEPPADVTLTDAKAIETAEADETVTAAKVWTYDPAQLKSCLLPQLLDEYKKRCAEYKIEPETFTQKAQIIKKMSSEFKK